VSNDILIPVSTGELIDKITILEIKNENISSEAKLANVRKELALLGQVLKNLPMAAADEISALQTQLKAVNKEIWDAEDVIRDLDRRREFGDEYIKVARSIYRLNDARADTKKKINILSGSSVVEEKGYSPY
jgi:predicted transcriptional regulator